MVISQELKNEVLKYWSNGRAGKHKDVIEQHALILNSTLKVKPADFFEQVNNNHFDAKAFDLISWNDFLRKTNLAEYVDESYVKLALDVTASRPALGKGEFLLVSCLGNLAFAPESGDIITTDSHEKIELKGMRATMAGDKPFYRTMNRDVMNNIFAVLPNNSVRANHDYFSDDDGRFLDNYIRKMRTTYTADVKIKDTVKAIFKQLQNVTPLDDSIAKECAEYYLSSDYGIFEVTGALHLCSYLLAERANYIIMTNSDGFCCFKNPITKGGSSYITKQDLANAMTFFNNDTRCIKLSSWQKGTKGMEISI